MQSEFSLDDSQRRVVDADPEDRLLVSASAGQGKTEVLVARAVELVDCGLNAADEILVLSFSRAAVEAMKKRARMHSLDGLQVRTFDSLAAEVLGDTDVDDITASYNFDALIRGATQVLKSDDPPPWIFSLKHVMIDEAQDLVGDRAEMVLSLFELLDEDFGFTVLGDSLQGIYDFQLNESHAKVRYDSLVDTLKRNFAANDVSLDYHYRALTGRTRELVDIGHEIRARVSFDEESTALAHESLDRFAREVSSSSILFEGGALNPAKGSTTAVLCSTNYEALVASELLWEEGLFHVVRRRAQEMSVAPWVYSGFSKLEDRTYPKQEIIEILEEYFGDMASDYWLSLKTAEGDYNSYSSLSISRLSQRLRGRSVPLSLTVEDQSPLVISTVHRSKGLEFDNVLYVKPQKGSPSGEVTFDSLKQKYVALSRARDEVIQTSLPKGCLKRAHSSSGRWLEKSYGKYGLYTARMEFGNSDIDDLRPYLPPDGSSPESVQSHLSMLDVVGESVFGRLDEKSLETEDVPRYHLESSSGKLLGRTSISFSYALRDSFSFRHSRKWRWPTGFTGARVISVECATGHPGETRALGLGDSGMWLVPRLTGLITRLKD